MSTKAIIKLSGQVATCFFPRALPHVVDRMWPVETKVTSRTNKP